MKAEIKFVETYKEHDVRVVNCKTEDGKWKAWYTPLPVNGGAFAAYGDTEKEALDLLKEVMDMMF
jgi:predicted RNase H-like HicB family nuclease